MKGLLLCIRGAQSRVRRPALFAGVPALNGGQVQLPPASYRPVRHLSRLLTDISVLVV